MSVQSSVSKWWFSGCDVRSKIETPLTQICLVLSHPPDRRFRRPSITRQSIVLLPLTSMFYRLSFLPSSSSSSAPLLLWFSFCHVLSISYFVFVGIFIGFWGAVVSARNKLFCVIPFFFLCNALPPFSPLFSLFSYSLFPTLGLPFLLDTTAYCLSLPLSLSIRHSLSIP